MYGLIDLYRRIKTEVVGWALVAAIILPGAVLTAALEQLTPLDRAQLWTLSIVFTGIIFLALVAALGSVDLADEIILWYPTLVIVINIVSTLVGCVLYFGCKATVLATVFSRMAPEWPDWLQ